MKQFAGFILHPVVLWWAGQSTGNSQMCLLND